jgi:hypothetical protein
MPKSTFSEITFMTHATEHLVHYLLAIALSAIALGCNSGAQAQDAGITGTWLLERGADFDGLVKRPTSDLPATLQVLDNRFAMTRGCSVQLLRQPVSLGQIFQSLLKADITKGEIKAFYQKQFKLDIYQVKDSLKNDLNDTTCYRGSMHLLQLDDTLVAVEAGGNFSFFYKRIAPVHSVAGAKQYSQLPFQMASYRALCPKGISWSGHKPLTGTNSCAPLYFPQIATVSATDGIARLVGHHNYEGKAVGGQALTNDYTNPVESGFQPVFQVFPPKGDITMVHVTDLEGSSSRDAMPGAYLSIRNGKVVSQLNSNCTMGLDYVCREVDSAVHYTLNSEGEFIQHDR